MSVEKLLSALLLSIGLVGSNGCSRDDDERIDIRELEKLYSHRTYTLLHEWNMESEEMQEYAALLDQRIELLPPSTIHDSLTLVKEMTPEMHYWLGSSVLLGHYGYAALDPIRECFMATGDPYLRGSLVGSVARIASSGAYGKDTLAVLGEALKDPRELVPPSVPTPTVVPTITDRAHEVVKELIAPEHLKPFTPKGFDFHQRHASQHLLGEWILENSSCLYVNADGKFVLDMTAAGEGQPTSQSQEKLGKTKGLGRHNENPAQEWTPLKPRREWKLPDRLDEIPLKEIFDS